MTATSDGPAAEPASTESGPTSAGRSPVRVIRRRFAQASSFVHERVTMAWRITVLTAAVVGATIAVAAVAAYVVVDMQMRTTLDQSLMARATAAAAGGAVAQVAGDVPAGVLGAADVRIAVIRADGRVESADRSEQIIVLGKPEYEVAKGAASSSLRTITAADGSRWRVATVPAGDDGALLLAQSLDGQERVLAQLAQILVVFGLLGVLFAGFSGWAVATNGLRPLRRLTSATEEITETLRLTPLPVGGQDELGRLSASFNRMLAALEASREHQTRLVIDAGHELRTPLTSLRTNIDLLNQSDQRKEALPEQARSELLDDTLAQIDELTTLIGDLTELARDDHPVDVVDDVDLRDTLEQSVARVRRRAPGLTFDVTAQPWIVRGEPAGLERAITNLLDNAAKWSPEGGQVVVRLDGGVLTVDDEGPGIAEDDRDRVFDRFWRSHEARTMPGSGLGLSIVAQMVERHSGTVQATSSPQGGARLVLRLPGTATLDR